MKVIAVYVMRMNGKAADSGCTLSVTASFYKVLFVLHLWNARQDIKIYGQVKHRRGKLSSEKGE